MNEPRSSGDKSPETTSQKARSAIAKAASGERAIHPALIPGVSVENTRADFKTNKTVFAVALASTVGIILWAIIAPDNLANTGSTMRAWVVQNFGWLFTIIMIATTAFLLTIAIAPTGKIKLGADDSKPDFSRNAWIAMLFAAGMGIGLVFYGPMEPLALFLTPPPYLSGVESGSQEAILPAFAQAVLHHATLPWMIFALVGGALPMPLIDAAVSRSFPRYLNPSLRIRITGYLERSSISSQCWSPSSARRPRWVSVPCRSVRVPLSLPASPSKATESWW